MILADVPEWSGAQLAGNWPVIRHYTLIHVQLALAALLIGSLAALILGLLSFRYRRLYTVVLAFSNAVYAMPSLGLIFVLSAIVGRILDDRPLIIALALYTLTILVRNIVEGLRAVSPAVSDASTAMGFTRTGRLFKVELPLAVPAISAGFRVAAVSTISLVSVAGIIGRGGLGFLLTQGFQKDNPWEVWAGVLTTVALAAVIDVMLVVATRLATPWRRIGVRNG
ncbi:MAG: transporter permease [Acidimicrobiia bacterium]|nr:transporter permease [Acidimicrobiia bacterium]